MYDGAVKVAKGQGAVSRADELGWKEGRNWAGGSLTAASA